MPFVLTNNVRITSGSKANIARNTEVQRNVGVFIKRVYATFQHVYDFSSLTIGLTIGDQFVLTLAVDSSITISSLTKISVYIPNVASFSILLIISCYQT